MTRASVDTSTSIRERKPGGWQAALLLAGSCMPVMGSVLITPVLPQLSQHFGGAPGAEVLVPMIVAIPALMIALFAPFAGQIIDRLGRKPLLIVSLIAYALAGTVPAWLDSLTGILISRAFVGVFEAGIMTVCTTLIVDYFREEKRRNRYLGLQTVATTLGATLFIAVGGAVGSAGWHAPFWIYSIAIVIAVAMIFSIWEPGRSDEIDRSAPGGAEVSKGRLPWGEIAIPLIITLFGGFTFYVLIIETSYLVVGTGVAVNDTATIGAVAAGASLATAAGALLFPRFARGGSQRLVPLAFVLQAAGMLLLWLIPGLPGVVLGAAVASFGSGILLPSLVTWVLSRTTFGDRGRVTGWWTSAFFFGQFLTPLVMGGLGAATGALPVAVGVVGIAAALVATALFIGSGARRRAVTTTP